MQTRPLTDMFELQLDEQLRADADGQLRRQLQQDLGNAEQRLRGLLARPLPRGEFAAASASLQAVGAAQEVLRQWAPAGPSSTPAGGGVAHRRQFL